VGISATFQRGANVIPGAFIPGDSLQKLVELLSTANGLVDLVDPPHQVGDVWTHEECIGPHYNPKTVTDVIGEDNLVTTDGGVWSPDELRKFGWKRR